MLAGRALAASRAALDAELAADCERFARFGCGRVDVILSEEDRARWNGLGYVEESR